MSEQDLETPTLESKSTPEQQAAAEKIGWIPPARYKGDPERFVDADAFIERGETVLPIVKKQLSEVRAENASLKAEHAKTAAALRAAQEAIEQIEERHTVATQKAVEEARKQLKQQLAAASEAGDHEAVAEITSQMTELNTADASAKPAKVNGEAKPPAYEPPPELVAWNQDNPWFGTDKRKTGLAQGIAADLREQMNRGEIPNLLGRPFFDLVTQELEKMLNAGKPQPRGDKVEGARGGEGDSRSGGKKGYAALPADAKAACDADSRRFVGPGKRYKTAAEWRDRYAELYFQES